SKNVYVKNEFDEVSFEQTEVKNKFVINLFEILNVFDKYDRETIFFLLEKTDGITQSIQKVNVKKYDYEIYYFESVVNEEDTLKKMVYCNLLKKHKYQFRLILQEDI